MSNDINAWQQNRYIKYFTIYSLYVELSTDGFVGAAH